MHRLIEFLIVSLLLIYLYVVFIIQNPVIASSLPTPMAYEGDWLPVDSRLTYIYSCIPVLEVHHTRVKSHKVYINILTIVFKQPGKEAIYYDNKIGECV